MHTVCLALTHIVSVSLLYNLFPRPHPLITSRNCYLGIVFRHLHSVHTLHHATFLIRIQEHLPTLSCILSARASALISQHGVHLRIYPLHLVCARCSLSNLDLRHARIPSPGLHRLGNYARDCLIFRRMGDSRRRRICLSLPRLHL